MAPTTELDALETRLVLQAIHERYGYDFRGYTPEYVTRRLKAVLAKSGLSHLGEVQHRLLTEPQFLHALLDDLTIHTSEMFRDPEFFRALREQLLPVLRTYPRLKVWHAGCATGEEVYATAITLYEAGLLDRTQIYATDISPVTVERAKEGVYPAASFDRFATNYQSAGGTKTLADYCVRAYGRVTLKEELRSSIVFFQHNLASDYALGEMQVVFCRNVLIYFGAELRQRVLNLFAQCLSRGGFLCLGRSEQVPLQFQPFQAFVAKERIYRKANHA